MAKGAIAGFIKGFTGNSLDRIAERRKLENEEKKVRMLAALQAETDRANFLFEEGYKKSNKVDESMSEKNFETGEITLRSLDGTPLGSRKINSSEKEEHLTKKEKDRLSLDASRANIRQSDASAEASRASAGYSRAAAANVGKKKGLDGSDNEPDDFDRAGELVFRYKTEIDEAVKSGNISESAVRSGAVALIQNSRNGQEAQSKFLEFLNNYRTGRKATDQSTRKPLDSL